MSVPRVLSDPPWRRHGSASEPSRPRVDPGRESARARLAWRDGERDAFRGPVKPALAEAAEERWFERLLDELDKQAPLRAGEIGRLGDEKLAELAGELDASTTDVATLKLVLGRLGDAFADAAVAIVRAAPRERGLFEAAMPLRSAELAKTAATFAFERAVDLPARPPASVGRDPPYVRSAPEEWLLRHADAAFEGLAGDGHAAARAALAYCAAFGSIGVPPDLHEAMAPYIALAELKSRADLVPAIVLATREDPRAASMLAGEPAAAAYVARVRGARAEKELADVPDAVAPLPAFFDVATIARPRLRDGAPLPDAALRALGEMMRFSPLAHPYAGLAQVREACDPASLDAFALDLFARWRDAGEEPREAWAFETCGKIGGEASAREVAAHVRSWARGAEPPRYAWDEDSHRVVMVAPGSRGFSFARTGCAILAAIEGDAARLLLDDLARSGVQAWLRKEASRALGREPSLHDDVEAPVPDVGLDADGSATFDLGARAFRLRFDETLGPKLEDANGACTATFPRARKDDDPKKHAAAKERFAAIVKDVKIVARYQIALVERMMCSGRTFAADAFRERFVAHPLLRHLGRRVVWIAHGETFRVAEDGSFANVDDAPFALAAVDPVGVVHPITLAPDSRAAWAERFADYAILQPFPQLARERFVREAREIGEHHLSRFVLATTTRGRLFQLGRRGWDARFDRVDLTEYTKDLPSGAVARFEVTPAVARGGAADQVFTIAVAACTWSLDRLPAVDYSELVRDLEYARAR